MSENPLTEEQIKTINEISKLDPEEQKQKLPEFLQTLDEEQMSFLKNQQGGQATECIFCSISDKKIESYKVYEDEEFLGVLDINPANKGHVLVFPKKHHQFLGELNEEQIGNLFNIVNKLGNKMVEKLKAMGVNIYVASGQGAGQTLPHISVNIIPRFENDKITFGWTPKKLSKKDFEDITKELKTNKLKKPLPKKKKEIIKIKKNIFERIP